MEIFISLVVLHQLAPETAEFIMQSVKDLISLVPILVN